MGENRWTYLNYSTLEYRVRMYVGNYDAIIQTTNYEVVKNDGLSALNSFVEREKVYTSIIRYIIIRYHTSRVWLVLVLVYKHDIYILPLECSIHGMILRIVHVLDRFNFITHIQSTDKSQQEPWQTRTQEYEWWRAEPINQSFGILKIVNLM